MQSWALNKLQRSKFHRNGVSHQPAPSIDKQKKDAVHILNVDPEELDNFARNFRIKEHFGSKEVQGGEKVSSDSD